jgi:hypothetical protein
MTDSTPELPTVGEAGAAFNPLHAVRSVLISLFVNGVCPYLLYRTLQPHYAAGSVVPLIAASVFPFAGLVGGIIRTRTIDYIALFALFEISYNVTTALLASTLGWAMILRSSEGFIVAAFFLACTLIGYPPIFYIARQFAVGSNPERRARFAGIYAADGGRTFVIASLVWAVGIFAQTLLNLALAINLSPAGYLLAAQVVSIAVNVSLVVWTIGFTRRRLERAVVSAPA